MIILFSFSDFVPVTHLAIPIEILFFFFLSLINYYITILLFKQDTLLLLVFSIIFPRGRSAIGVSCQCDVIIVEPEWTSGKYFYAPLIV